MRTSNPVLQRAFGDAALGHGEMAQMQAKAGAMTVAGAAIKTGVLLALCIASAAAAWQAIAANSGLLMPLWIGGMLVGVVLALIVSFAPKTAPYLAPVYAIAEGLFLGAISLVYERAMAAKGAAGGSGIVMQAVLITFGILATLIAGYAFGFLRLGSTARKCVIVATGGIGLTYVVSIVMSLLGFGGLGFIHSGGIFGIGFSLFVVGIASLNLVLDFQFIEEGAEAGLPKHMEWYGAFGLMVTLVWLYIEVLRLLSKLRK